MFAYLNIAVKGSKRSVVEKFASNPSYVAAMAALYKFCDVSVTHRKTLAIMGALKGYHYKGDIKAHQLAATNAIEELFASGVTIHDLRN